MIPIRKLMTSATNVSDEGNAGMSIVRAAILHLTQRVESSRPTRRWQCKLTDKGDKHGIVFAVRLCRT